MTLEMNCLVLNTKVGNVDSIAPLHVRRIISLDDGLRSKNVLVEIKAAAVNPSDVKAAIGMIPYAVFPRVPGRDYSGIVIDGPTEYLGMEVFGSSGDLGIRRDGSHSTHMIVEAEALVKKPNTMSFEEAAGIGVPFVTAAEGYRRSGFPTPEDTVLIMGINGKVGQAAAQIATWKGARVIGVVRRPESYAGHSNSPIEIIDSSQGNVAQQVREMTNGKGASIIFNTVGDPYYQDAHLSTAVLGRHILISAINKIVEFNIFEFYRGRHTYLGIDTLALSSIETGDVLRDLYEGFVQKTLRPFKIHSHAVFPLAEAKNAYAMVLGSTKDRIVFNPHL
jgi:NADPH:quinone reductase